MNYGTAYVKQDSGFTTVIQGRSGFDNYGTVYLEDGTICSKTRNGFFNEGTGTFEMNGGKVYSTATGTFGRAISTEGNVIITKGEIYATGSYLAGTNYNTAFGIFGGSVTFSTDNDDDIIVTTAADYVVYVDTGSAEINGGTFKCTGTGIDEYNELYGDVTPYGGLFLHNPAPFIEDYYYVSIDASSGLYKVS